MWRCFIVDFASYLTRKGDVFQFALSFACIAKEQIFPNFSVKSVSKNRKWLGFVEYRLIDPIKDWSMYKGIITRTSNL